MVAAQYGSTKRLVASPDFPAGVKTAQRLLLDLARRLETEYPCAAESVREGLDETLTVLTQTIQACSPAHAREMLQFFLLASYCNLSCWYRF